MVFEGVVVFELDLDIKVRKYRLLLLFPFLVPTQGFSTVAGDDRQCGIVVGSLS